MSKAKALMDGLKGYPRVFIQAHDFPDHDAVSSAFALQFLLEKNGIASHLMYNGSIDRASIQRMIKECGINVSHWQDTDVTETDIIITIDGCIGEKNMFDVPGQEIAVIDHHDVSAPAGLWFSDVRPEYGATATIMVEYFVEQEVAMPAPVATALHIGLNIDTANLTRGYCSADIEAFSYLHKRSDANLVNVICKNTLEKKDFEEYRKLLSGLEIHRDFAFAYLDECYSKNALGILGDFLVSADEIDVAIVAARIDDKIFLSLRSERIEKNVAILVRGILVERGIGFGGGHAHMAGGVVNDETIIHDSNAGSLLRDLFIEGCARL